MLYTFKKSKINIGLQIKKKLVGQKRALQQVILHKTNAKNVDSVKAVGRCLPVQNESYTGVASSHTDLKRVHKNFHSKGSYSYCAICRGEKH